MGPTRFCKTCKRGIVQQENHMKISARNVFSGKVTAIKTGAVNDEIDFTTTGGDKIVAIVTTASTRQLGLAVGSSATALVKASSVMVLTEGSGLKLSARNCLAGKVSALSEGPVSAEVSITLAGGDVVHATITHDAVTELGINPGAAATAVFKASSVILAVGA
jgi:molybdate transport system regulatory protein